MGDGTISFKENVDMYVSGLGDRSAFKAKYKGYGKNTVTFTKSGTDQSLSGICLKKIGATNSACVLGKTAEKGIDSMNIASENCYCTDAWEELLTGGDWHTPNSTVKCSKI